METANNTAMMHVTETKTLCSSQNCPKTKNEEITREREEELLYGSNEDGDDEDALSDDSFRLRVSDEGEEQQQATNRDLTEEFMKQNSTEMELESDVPPSDITERKSLLKCENLTNGKCTIAKHLSHPVEGANEGIHMEEESSFERAPTRSDNNIDCTRDESQNGDIDKSVNASFESSMIESSTNNKWRYSGRFGNYTRSGKRKFAPRPIYTMNSCSEKYYNQNTHYGGGKNCAKSYSLHNTKGTRVNFNAGSPNTLSSNHGHSSSHESTIDRAIIKQDEDIVSSVNVDAECSSVDIASSSVNNCSNDTATELENVIVTSDVLANIETESSDILTKKDNAEAAYECTNNFDSNFNVNQDENISDKAGKTNPIIDEEASEVDVDNDKVAEVPVNDETNSQPLVDESFDNAENYVGEEASSVSIHLDNIEGEVESLNNVPDAKTEESETFERIDVNIMFENTNDVTGEENASINIGELENNENLVPERNDETIEKVTLEGEETKNHETVASKEEADCANDEIIETEETYIIDNDEKVETEVSRDCDNDEKIVTKVSSDSDNDKIIISETSNGFTHDEKLSEEKVNECAKQDESMSNQENSCALNNEELYLPTNEAKVTKVDDRENDIVESVDETLDETLKSSTQDDSVKAEDDDCPESLAGRSLASPETLSNLRSLKKLPKDLFIVAIVEPETNEDERAVIPLEPDHATATKSPLTDNEKKSLSSDDSDRVGSSNDRLDNNETIFRCSLKRPSTDTLLDEMELSKRLQIDRDRGDVTCSEYDNKEIHCARVTNLTVDPETTKGKDTSIIENTVTSSNGESRDSITEDSVISNNVVEKSSVTELSVEDKTVPVVTENHEIDDDEKIDDCEVIEIPIKRKQKRSRRSLNSLRESIVSQEDSQETENIRQKRKTAQNAEEIIRKECLANTDSESNDSLSKFVTVNHRTNNNLRPTSPPTLKRNFVDDDETKNEITTTKKLKADVTVNGDISTKNETIESETKRTLQHVRNFFRRDGNGSLCKLMQEELEELLIQKVVETITMKGEIGKLREQAKVAERNQEATRLRCQQLSKQIKDLDMVLTRFKSDLRSNPDSKTVVAIKINRSVGLQVNFVTDHGIQNLRQLQQAQKMSGSTVAGTIGLQQQQQMQQQKQPVQQAQTPSEPSPSGPAVKRTVKVRSPRRPEHHPPVAPDSTAVPTPVNSPHVSTVTPAALVVSKPVSDLRPSVTPANQQTTVMHPPLISSNQAILVNGNVTGQSIRQAPTLQASKAKNNDLIDLTQEEEKTKTPVATQNTVLTAAFAETSPGVSNIQKLAPRFHTVIQTIPNMSVTTQSGIRVVQPSSQPTPTALVNNMNAPRLTYVTMQSGMVPRQVVLTSTPTPIRPAPTNNIRTTFPISGTITNNTVRVLPATGIPTLLYKHPAPLPESLNPLSSPSWKLPPPAPSLKISKVANGIVLSWNMALSDKFADIASYQLYAYQELAGMAPSSTLWKKVGDVRALPLPMACTLTQFSEGNNYYFAVRAVDKHSRLGQYSQPGNISL